MSQDHISIEAAKTSHYEAIVSIYNHYIIDSVATFDCEVFDYQERQSWFEQFSETGFYRLFIALNEMNTVVGYACSTPFNERKAYQTSVNISYYCLPNEVGKGIGTKLLHRLMAALKETSVHKLYAGVTLPNPASIRLLEKTGFSVEGTFTQVGLKFNQYWDVQWLGKTLDH